MPGLIWNTMMSMSGGWFFVVASEAISVGTLQISLPGIGSYVAYAIEQRDLHAVGWAILAMTATILIYDQLMFRPLVAWADKFRYEQTAAQAVPRSWVLELFQGSILARVLGKPMGSVAHAIVRFELTLPWSIGRLGPASSHLLDVAWYGLIFGGVAYLAWALSQYAGAALSRQDVFDAVLNGGLTLLRVVVLIAIATLVWVPIGVAVGLRPRLAEKVQPLAQFMAAFPADLLFPVAVYPIVTFELTPAIWLSPLMILGTQWHILFNVIAGATAFPSDFREAAASFRIPGWHWWREVMLPGIFPYYVTGAITASGGAWNASIVSEAVSWGPTRLSGGGLGAYIAQMTEAGDFLRIALGIAVMSVLVVSMNRLVWRPLYGFAERRTPIGLRGSMLKAVEAATIDLQNISMVFKRPTGEPLPVLENINISMRDGEILGLLGRSGSGKSTLLRIAAGLIKPTSGIVNYKGSPLTGPAEGIAVVFQTFALFPWLTVLQNVIADLEALRLPENVSRQRAEAAIDLIGLDGFQSAYPRELSGGMRQRVGFARALVTQPAVLLMDEPFSALDVLTAETLRSDFLDLWIEHRLPTRSVLIVTHNVEEAVMMCDRVLVLASNPGHVAAEIPIGLPHPRNRLDDEFRSVVDEIYSVLTARTVASIGALKGIHGGLAHPLPQASVNRMSGLIEKLAAAPFNGEAELGTLASWLNFEVDDLFPSQKRSTCSNLPS